MFEDDLVISTNMKFMNHQLILQLGDDTDKHLVALAHVREKAVFVLGMVCSHQPCIQIQTIFIFNNAYGA